MRLIDADAIPYCNYDLDNYHSFTAVEDDVIAEMPTIDAVPVVRCKDCKHMVRMIAACYCAAWGGFNGLGEDGFCNYGERREE